MDMLRGFSWHDGISDSPFVLEGLKEPVWVSNTEVDLPSLQSTPLDQRFHQLARLTLCVPPSRSTVGIGILTNLPSPTPFGLGLGPD